MDWDGQQEISLHVLKNPEAEAAWAASQIRKLVREKGYHYRDFALIAGDMEAYSPVLERVLPEYGIPCFLDNKRSVLKNPFVEFIRALLEIDLETGRYHQIRLQLSHAGMPIAGDGRYADERRRRIDEENGIQTLCLQAVKLCFTHPTAKKRFCYELDEKLDL